MDALVALGDHGAHAEQVRALGGPVARRAGAVLLAGEQDQRHALLAVALGRVEDRHLLAVGEVRGPRALAARDEQVAQADVGEGAAHHHLVVAAARAVGVEEAPLDAVLEQVLAGRAVGLDRAGRRDVVGGDAVAERDEAARALDVLQRLRLRRHALEERRPLDVGRALVPGVQVALGNGQRLPALVAGEDVGVLLVEHAAVERGGDGLLDLRARGPEVAQEDVGALAVLAERLGVEVDVDPAGERVGHDERRRGQVVRPHLGMDARLEVAVAREHRADDEVVLLDGLRDRLRQRPGVPDAGRAAVADGVEAELLEVRRQAGLVVVVGDDARAGRERRLDPRLALEPALDRLLREQAGAEHDLRVRGVRAARDRGDHDGAVAAARSPRRRARPGRCAAAGAPRSRPARGRGRWSCGPGSWNDVGSLAGNVSATPLSIVPLP